jgi:hypothetical protein
MMHLHQLAHTHAIRYPLEQAERERTAQRALLAAEARRVESPIVTRRAERRSLVPRIAGALGLF